MGIGNWDLGCWNLVLFVIGNQGNGIGSLGPGIWDFGGVGNWDLGFVNRELGIESG